MERWCGHLHATIFPPQEKLLSVTTNDVLNLNFLQFRAFHTVTPTADSPVLCALNTLLKYKSGISVFMPRKNSMKWDPVTLTANPTMSCEVNELTQDVQRSEVRGEGMPDQARRVPEWADFITVLLCIRTMFGVVAGARRALVFPLLTILTVQWKLIARIDDVMQLEKLASLVVMHMTLH